jgi:hypothetical protein
MAGDGWRASSRPPVVCITCGLPVPQSAAEATLADRLLEALRQAPAEGVVAARLAKAIHVRRVDAEAGLGELGRAGLVERADTARGYGRGNRGRPWRLTGPGRIGDASWSPAESSADGWGVFAGIAALVAAEPLARLLALAGVALLVAALAVAAREAHRG